jgi:hypothetical protein
MASAPSCVSRHFTHRWGLDVSADIRKLSMRACVDWCPCLRNLKKFCATSSDTKHNETWVRRLVPTGPALAAGLAEGDRLIAVSIDTTPPTMLTEVLPPCARVRVDLEGEGGSRSPHLLPAVPLPPADFCAHQTGAGGSVCRGQPRVGHKPTVWRATVHASNHCIRWQLTALMMRSRAPSRACL